MTVEAGVGQPRNALPVYSYAFTEGTARRTLTRGKQ